MTTTTTKTTMIGQRRRKRLASANSPVDAGIWLTRIFFSASFSVESVEAEALEVAVVLLSAAPVVGARIWDAGIWTRR